MPRTIHTVTAATATSTTSMMGRKALTSLCTTLRRGDMLWRIITSKNAKR